jgi:hypothetical protein|tara:strand:+ start:161 stop:931 length:771 start_codon:yes stop_codon:yes gene_type:complete
MERFYCVGCKSHYELPVKEAVEKPSKGGSTRYSLVGECPKGHKTTRICKREVYDSYSAEEAVAPAEVPESAVDEPFEGVDAVPAGPSEDPLPAPSATGNPIVADEHAEVPSDFAADTVVGTMSPGISLEALEPLEGGLENSNDPSLVPKDDFMPEGDGRVIGSQSTSHNYTPMHAEDEGDTDICDSCDGVFTLEEMGYTTDGDGICEGCYYDIYVTAQEPDMKASETFFSNHKAKLATAAAALTLALVYFNSRNKQ